MSALFLGGWGGFVVFRLRFRFFWGVFGVVGLCEFVSVPVVVNDVLIAKG